jgi:hypothetical protein
VTARAGVTVHCIYSVHVCIVLLRTCYISCHINCFHFQKTYFFLYVYRGLPKDNNEHVPSKRVLFTRLKHTYLYTIDREHESNSRTHNKRLGGVMVTALISNSVDRGFEPRSGQTKDYEYLHRLSMGY